MKDIKIRVIYIDKIIKDAPAVINAAPPGLHLSHLAPVYVKFTITISGFLQKSINQKYYDIIIKDAPLPRAMIIAVPFTVTFVTFCSNYRFTMTIPGLNFQCHEVKKCSMVGSIDF